MKYTYLKQWKNRELEGVCVTDVNDNYRAITTIEKFSKKKMGYKNRLRVGRI